MPQTPTRSPLRRICCSHSSYINRTEQALTIVEIPLENPAYIIHTSGTTGDPKGVVISHKAAVNTIEDINSRFDINSADRMFGLANLAFDLSVYDIFGAFNAGAALVLPDPEKQKDPYYWVETIKKNEITVWNSVPAQMQMLVSVLESRGVSGDFPLKVVLLSGDWIPVTLPDQIHTSCKKAKVVSLGGATEAAIWSIYHEIEEVPDGAVSIPYGKPLANQKFYVLNEKMEQCPDWVPGDLYIGGKGLALEYLNKPEETNAHFMYDEQLQERIYKTGDIGRYWPDGTIEFMGREDTQVKIHGHRIELSEIESALLSNTLVKTAVAVIVGKRPQDYKIVAFVEGNIEVSELTEYIKTQVPEYMVPSRFEVNEKIPLSANGKVERKALKKLAETYFQNTGKCEMPPHEGLEKEIAELWKTLLKIDRVNRTDNFYDIGGDSLLVAQAVSKTKEAINVAKDVEWDRLMIGMLQNPTIMDFAQFLNSVQIGTSHEENEISETPLNIIADIPEGGEVMKVFFPGGIGFLQQFNTLFQILVNNPERTEGIAAFNYTEDKEYLDSEEKDHIVTIGRRYADLLLNSGYRKFKLIGYCMGGLVAIEAARALLEAGAEVLPVVTIDTIPIVLEMEGDLLMERSYGLMVGADVSKAGHVKGIHVIQEHPVHYNDIVKLLKVAKENNCVYQVNSFYPNVKNVQEFIVKSNKLLKKSRPTYIDATCSTQVLFPMISILGKALSGFHTWKLQTIDSVNSKFPFKVLSGEIRGIPAIVKIQNQLDPKDPDNNGFLLHRIVLGTTEGSLCLDNSNGLVIWNPQMYVPHAEGVLDMYGNNSYVELPVSEVADGVRNTTYAEVYKELWPEGIVCALNDFARAITDNSQKNIMAQQMLTISEIWKDLSEKIGSPQLIVTPERNGIRLADIAE